MSDQGNGADFKATEPDVDRYVTLSGYCLAALSALGALSVLIWFMVYSRYGLDFTDEGYYLAWLAAPGLYDWSLSQFGFIYQPLYFLLGGDIPLLRMLNVLVIFALSWYLVDIILRDAYDQNTKNTVQRIALSFGFAIGSLCFFSVWVPTPSYNSLNLQGLLVVASGLFLAQRVFNKESALGWTLIGVGGWLTFMAKPSSAAALGVIVFFSLLIARKINLRLMLLSLMSALVPLLLSALVIDGSVLAFVERLQTAMVFVGYLGGGHTLEQLMRIDDFTLAQGDVWILGSAVGLACSASILLSSKIALMRNIGIFVVSLALLFSIAMAHGEFILKLQNSNFHGLLMLAVPASMLLLAIVFSGHRFVLDLSLSRLSTALTISIFPHIYAFGTNNNYWQAGSLAAFFWLIAALILVVPSMRRVKATSALLPLVLLTQLVVVLLVQLAMESPYRQIQPLRLNSQTVEVGSSGSSLILSEGYAAYLTQIRKEAIHAGFEPGTPIIDLSGQSPGVLHALGAANIGQAWMIGGYPGSFKLATEALKRVSCGRLADAWILTEPEGPRSISDSLIHSFGAHLSDYEVVATWNTAAGAGGYEQRPAQKLLKPVRDIQTSMLACVKKRED